jgi:hypothetical protein
MSQTVMKSKSDNLRVVVSQKPKVLINQSGIIFRSLGDLTDVDISNKQDGSLLIYDEETGKFVASTILEKQIINGGHF